MHFAASFESVNWVSLVFLVSLVSMVSLVSLVSPEHSSFGLEVSRHRQLEMSLALRGWNGVKCIDWNALVKMVCLVSLVSLVCLVSIEY
jgi:hypothetical protein